MKEVIVMLEKSTSKALNILAFPTVLMICVSILLSGCNIIEKSTISTEPSTNLSETTESESSEASNTSEETIAPSTSYTGTSTTYESIEIHE